MDPFRSFILFPELFDKVDEFATPYRTKINHSIPLEVISGENYYKVKVNVAGADPDSISVKVNGKIVVISGEFKILETLEDNETVLLNEMSRGQFSRQITLPEPVDSETVQANLEEGILKLYFPKTEPNSGKTIKINKSDKK